MLIEYICLLLLGIAAGIAAGLLPGLHVNNIGVMALPLLGVFGPIGFAIFLTAMATSQGFLNFIPSIFLGAPEESTVLSLLPTHRMLFDGRSREAVRLTGLANLYGVVLSVMMLPLAFVLVPIAYSAARAVVLPLLFVAVGFLILRERKAEKILWASTTFFISGYLGWTCLNITTMSSDQILLSLFSGLFGMGTLMLSLSSKQKNFAQDSDDKIEISPKSLWRNSLVGTLGGIIVGLVPGMSPSQIGIFFQEISALKNKAGAALEEFQTRQFIATVASLGAADALFSIFGVYLMGNPRSGISVILQDVFGEMDLSLLATLAGVMLVSAAAAYKAHIFIGYRFARLASRIDLKKLSLGAIMFVISMVFLSAGLFGLLIMAVSTLVGLLPALTGVSRTHCMGCLLVPSMLFFMGLG